MSWREIMRGELSQKRRKRWGERRIGRSLGDDAERGARWIVLGIGCLLLLGWGLLRGLPVFTVWARFGWKAAWHYLTRQ